MKFYSDKLRQIRTQQKITSEMLAEKMGIHRTTISAWERNKIIPTESKIRLIARILKITIDKISDLAPDKSLSDNNINESVPSAMSLAFSDSEEQESRINHYIFESNSIIKELSDSTVIIKALLKSLPSLFYVKNTELKYVMANSSFLKNISLTPFPGIQNKSDYDLFSKDEANTNSEEDEKVLKTGKAIINREAYIPGSDEKKWGLISKLPILDNCGRIEGLLGIFTDITERRKNEVFREIIEKCLSNRDVYFWIGRGLKKLKGKNVGVKETIYTLKSKATDYYFKGRENCSRDENAKFLHSLRINNDRVFPDFSSSDEEIPLMDQYYQFVDPFDSKKIHDVHEVIGHERKHDLYFGMIQKKYDPKLEPIKKLLRESMNEEHISQETIERILAKLTKSGLFMPESNL